MHYCSLKIPKQYNYAADFGDLSFIGEKIMSNEDSFEDFAESSGSKSRRTYLLTYSQADLGRYPTCLSFSEMILCACESVKSSGKIKHWACCREQHQNGGSHYHMSTGFDGTRRWKPIKDYIYNNENISINFSTKTLGYVAAYRYVCKEKPPEDVLHSPEHTNLKNIVTPKTNKVMHKYSDSQKEKQKALFRDDKSEGSCNKPDKTKRLRNSDVASLMVSENIKNNTELFKLTYQRNESGEHDLKNFILKKSAKALSDLVSTTWKIQNAETNLERRNKPRMQIIAKQASGVCITGCNEKWYNCASEVLQNNQINLYWFAGATRQAPTKRRQKNVNILIVGPTDCGKIILVKPARNFFQSFCQSCYLKICLDRA